MTAPALMDNGHGQEPSRHRFERPAEWIRADHCRRHYRGPPRTGEGRARAGEPLIAYCADR